MLTDNIAAETPGHYQQLHVCKWYLIHVQINVTYGIETVFGPKQFFYFFSVVLNAISTVFSVNELVT